MTKEEAMKYFHEDIEEAFKSAIKALEQEDINSVLEDIKEDIKMYEVDCRYSVAGTEGQDICRSCNDNMFKSIYRIIDKRRQ